MKRFLLPLLLLFCLFSYISCQKFGSEETLNEQISSNTASKELKILFQDPFVEKAALILHDSLSAQEFNSLDFSKYSIYKDEKSNPNMITIPIKNKNINRFIILGFKDGKIIGNWVETDQSQVELINSIASGTIKTQSFDKNISSSVSFRENRVVQITRNENGNVKAANIRYTKYGKPIISSEGTQLLARPEADPDGYVWLPEVVVVGYKNNYTSFNFYSLFWAYNQAPSYIYSYTTQNPYSGGGGGGTNVDIPPYTIESDQAIDLTKLLNCFNSVNSSGASYEIKLCTDLPVNYQPTALTTLLFTPGHAFITLTKTNGNQSVSQSFGFYPLESKTSIFNDPVPSKMVYDKNHEYNASIKFSLNPMQFDAAINKAKYLATNLYDLNDFNCTNYALDVFNEAIDPNVGLAVPDWIGPPHIAQPGQPDINYGTTPNGLYKLLQQLSTNSVYSSKINIGTFDSPTGSGLCQ